MLQPLKLRTDHVLGRLDHIRVLGEPSQEAHTSADEIPDFGRFGWGDLWCVREVVGMRALQERMRLCRCQISNR